MKMIPLKQALTLMHTAAQRAEGVSVRLCTFKRDRWVELSVQPDGLLLRVSGYEHSQELYPDFATLKHPLKQALEREFPRSHMVYYVEQRTQ